MKFVAYSSYKDRQRTLFRVRKVADLIRHILLPDLVLKAVGVAKM